MLLNIAARAAIHSWLSERKVTPDGWTLIALIPFLFTILESLYNETRKLPLQVPYGGLSNSITDAPNGYSFGLWLIPQGYSTLRAILALSRDLVYVLEKIKNMPAAKELGPSIISMWKEAKKFEDAGDFFTHMDEVWRDPAIHGVDGPFTIANTSRYTSKAKNQVYLIWHNDTIYFSHKKKQREVQLRKEAFDDIFEAGRQLLTEIRNNRDSIKERNSLPIEKVFPKYA